MVIEVADEPIVANAENTMKRLMLAVVLATIGSVPASSHESIHKALKIIHPWVYETEAKEITLQLKIRNAGKSGERLMRATSPLAASTTIVDAQGAIANGLAIPGGGELVLRSDGSHILLSGLTKPLRAYDSFGLTLVFEKAGEVKVQVMVEEEVHPSGR
jgi:copper(I)-binding protein